MAKHPRGLGTIYKAGPKDAQGDRHKAPNLKNHRLGIGREPTVKGPGFAVRT